MMLQTPGRIYLADQHGTHCTPHSSRCSVFSFGAYQDAQRPALGRLLAFNQETLGGGQQLTLDAPQDVGCLVLPLTGAIQCAVSAEPVQVEVEQVWVSRLSAQQSVTLHNPFPEDAVQFLHIWLEPNQTAATQLAPVLAYTFEELEQGLARVMDFSDDWPFALLLGRFQGRQETAHPVQQPGNLIFAYALAGAFEIEGRLLHPNDGLALWPTQAAEIEALSNNALLLLLEVKG
ncbi:pirin family protein [Hymenobacter rigui]|uniref:Quercetin 2,3-dioxygenase C-terminal cupin domain-containing protein n=1 Tax=Hymenobacter rigui TaxID=334424 RepID=A0A428KXP5_9BACT|nr:hypothetical protein [Hymenobacter rigui]RSK51472.1 hypothetical protein EI291_03950 [Hymenobacter rigui]